MICITFSTALAEKKHDVKKGDTLWDLAGEYYNDSHSWPVIWKFNTFINNPDLIYPREKIMIPGYTKGGDRLSSSTEVFKLGSNSVAEVAPVADTQTFNTTADYEVERRSAIRTVKTAKGLELIPYAFNFEKPYTYETLQKKLPKMKVIATAEGKEFVSTGDVLRVNAGANKNVKPGDKIVIFSLDKKISEGYVLETTGIGEVKKVDITNSLLMLTNSYDSISKNDYAAPLMTLKKTNPVGFMDVNSNVQGKIIYLHNGSVLTGEGYNCIINLGSTNGIKAGDILHVTRKVTDDSYSRIVKLAEIQIIYTNEHSATAHIIQSDIEIKNNDNVILRKVAVN